MKCSNCKENELLYATTLAQLTAEIAFLEERQALTVARKSDLMQDWLADQAVKNSLRCQLRRAGLEPVI